MKIKYFLIVSIFVLAVLCFGGFVNAQTIDNSALIAQLQAEIQSLMQQIAQLQSQQGNTVTWCHTFNSNLGIGSTGQELYALENALQKEGFTPPPFGSGHAGNGMSPIFDGGVAASVVQFQAKYGISQVGVVGPITRAKLNSLYGCGITPPTCVPNWTCGWGPCVNGSQGETVIDSNNCPPNPFVSMPYIACPALARVCNNSNSVTINSVSGPNSLNVGQAGTWGVNATASIGTNLNYSVDWGDATYPTVAGNSANVNQTSTFTHSYLQAGTYTVKFTVSGAGNSAQTSMTVVVGGTLNDNLSITYAPDPANWHDYVGGNYSKTFSVVNSSASRTYNWTISSGSLPTGLGITNNYSYSVNIMGTPTQAGNFPFTLTVRDDLGNTGSLSLNIYIEYSGPIAMKPVIYLYPEKTEAVKVQLDYKGKIIADYPAYDTKISGWEVAASPDGKIIDKADGREYSYLFWEGADYNKTNYDLSTGFVVKGTDARAFLQNILSKIGLTPKEYNEFIVYWYPKMQNNAYNLIHFAGKEYTDTAKLTITPTPDSMLRVFMVLKPLDHEIKVSPQQITPFSRNGFSVVEWGGTELDK